MWDSVGIDTTRYKHVAPVASPDVRGAQGVMVFQHFSAARRTGPFASGASNSAHVAEEGNLNVSRRLQTACIHSGDSL